MAAATFAGPAFAVLARFIIDDLGLTRAELGWAVAAFSAVGAVASPTVGRLTDVIGGRKAVAAIFGFSGAGILAIAAAPNYWWLVASAALTGIGQASGNPGTNKLISLHIPEGRRGAVTGLKQSGVQAGVFLAGMLLPAGAVAWGWRPTMAIAGGLSLVTLGVVGIVVPPDPPRVPRSREAARLVWSASIVWLMFYGFLMGAAGGGVNTYIPLYGQESLGLSVTLAGSVAGTAGFVAFITRVLWARHSEASGSYIRSLTQIAGLAIVFVVALLAAPTGGSWLLWVGALGLAASATSWNSVGMLAVMVYAGHDQAGGASGVVLLGFLGGLGVGPPLFGWSVDHFGDYAHGLWAALAIFLVAALLGLSWQRSTVRRSQPRATPG
jgi:MFS family permease